MHFDNRLRFVFWATAALVFCGLPASAAEENKRPNILFAIADNWAWPHASALGDPTVKTPVFDRVAHEGVLFTHTFCPVPSCSPTRSAMLTGRPAHQLEHAANLWSAFPKKFRVFTDMLRESAYDVGFTGKGWSPGNYKDFGWAENPVGKEFKDFGQFMQERDAAKPFFFWLGDQNTALKGWHYDAEGGAGPDRASIAVPPIFPDSPDVRKAMLAYYGGVQRLDLAVGDAIALLEKAGLLENTIVIYTSDNG